MKKCAIAILFILPLMGYCQEPTEKVIDRVLAVVGKNIILHSDLETQFSQYLKSGYPVDDGTRCYLLEDLLFQKLLLTRAQLDSLNVSESQVEAELDRRLRFFIQQIGSERKLEEYYQKSIVQIKEEFREMVQEQLMVQQMQGKITADTKVTPGEVREYFNSIPKDSLPFISSEVEMAHIAIYSPISEEQKKLAWDKINNMRERILNGEKFTTLAVLYSEDKLSAKNGGELGFMGRAELVPEFAAVAFKLQDDQVSKIVETQYGYHIIQLIARRGEKVNVRHILVQPKQDNSGLAAVKHELDSIRGLVMKDSLTFAEAAQQFSQDENTANSGGNMINMQSGETRFQVDQLDPTLFFVVDKLKEGEISEPVAYQSPDGKSGMRIIMLKKRTQPHQANLKDDYQRLQQAALTEKKGEALNNWVAKTIKSTYIKLNEGFEDCEFTHNWQKKLKQ